MKKATITLLFTLGVAMPFSSVNAGKSITGMVSSLHGQTTAAAAQQAASDRQQAARDRHQEARADQQDDTTDTGGTVAPDLTNWFQ